MASAQVSIDESQNFKHNIKHSNYLYNIADPNKSKTISNRSYRQNGDSEIEMGNGIQRDLSGI